MQVACGIVTDSGRKDAEGKPVMVTKYGFHALRHAAASLFIEAGFSPKRLQDIMGHSSIQMTFDVYGHLFPTPEDDPRRRAGIESQVLA